MRSAGRLKFAPAKRSTYKFAGVTPDIDLDYINNDFWVAGVHYSSVAAAVTAGVCVQTTPSGGKLLDGWVLPSNVQTALATSGSGVTMLYMGTIPDTSGMSATSPNDFRLWACLDNNTTSSAEAAQFGMLYNGTGPKVSMSYLFRSGGTLRATLTPASMFNMPVGSVFRNVVKFKNSNHLNAAHDALAKNSSNITLVDDSATSTNPGALGAGLVRLIAGNNGAGARAWKGSGVNSSEGLGRIVLWVGTPFTDIQLKTLANVDVNAGAPGSYTGFITSKATRLSDGTVVFATSEVGVSSVRGYQVDEATGQVLRRVTTSSTVSGGDDHNTTAFCQTPGGHLIAATCTHGSTGNVSYRRNATALPDFEGLATATEVQLSVTSLGASAVAAYAQFFVASASSAHPNRIYLFTRTGNFSGLGATYVWAYFTSDDDGVTWAAPKALINGEQQYYILGRWVSDNILRLYCNENTDSQGTGDGVRVMDWDISADTMTWLGGSKSTASAYVSVKVDSVPVFAADPDSDTNKSAMGVNYNGLIFLVAEKHATAGDAYIYSYQYGGSGSQYDPANYTKLLVAYIGLGITGAVRFTGGAAISARSDLTYPRAYVGVNDAANAMWHIRQYDLIAGVWTLTRGEIDRDTNASYYSVFRPVQIDGAVAGGMQIIWCRGTYKDFNNYDADFVVRVGGK